MLDAALDTSSNTASFVIYDRSAKQVIAAAHDLSVGRRSANLLPDMVRICVAAKVTWRDIARWTIGAGPGSFTGIRVGAALVQGICAGSGSIYRGVPSSVAMAWQAMPSAGRKITTVHDGRRREVILSPFQYTGTRLNATGDAAAVPLTALSQDADTVYVTLAENPALAANELRVITLPYLDATNLMTAPGWQSKDASTNEPIEPLYVRPAVFVKPRPISV